MTVPGGRELAQIARLRAVIAPLARGGEYDVASELLRELAVVDLQVGLVSDALRRSRQAAVLARETGDRDGELRAELLLAVALVEARHPETAEVAADNVLHRLGQATERERPHLATVAYLVRAIASRRAGHLASARVAIEQARIRATRRGRPELTALALIELGGVDLDEGDADAAAVCFWFARDAYALAGLTRAAGRATAMALGAYLRARRPGEVAALAPESIDEADRGGDTELAARVAGVLADALIDLHRRDDAEAAARDAARRAEALEAGPARPTLLMRSRLRQVRLEADPGQQMVHLEAAFDLALSARDTPAIAGALEWAVDALVRGEVPAAGWDVVTRMAAVMRDSGWPAVADVAEAAVAELR